MAAGARASVLALAAAGVLGACATWPRPAPPEVLGVAVRVVELRLPDVRLAVDVAVRNPNDRELAVEALDATLSLGDADVGRASLVRPVTLPARGDASVPLDVRADASVALAQVGRSLGSARPLDYELRGTLRAADGSIVPFRRRGTLPQPARP